MYGGCRYGCFWCFMSNATILESYQFDWPQTRAGLIVPFITFEPTSNKKNTHTHIIQIKKK